MYNINTKEDIRLIYDNIKKDISDILLDIFSVSNIEKDEDRKFLEGLLNSMKEMDKKFEEDINSLEKNAEWDKFTIAFFGETNAGKSTIIESLRIIFDEKNRREEIEENMKKYKVMETQFENKYNELITSLDKLSKVIEDEDMKSTNEIIKVKNEVEEMNNKYNTEIIKAKNSIKKTSFVSIIFSSAVSVGVVLAILKFVFNMI